MTEIVLDLEFSPIDKEYGEARRVCHNEIIQIGAVKLDENHEIIDRFNEYVKPQMTHIAKKVTALTGIKDEDVSQAKGYIEVMNSFIDWIDDEDAILLSWSMEDLNQLKQEGKLKKYNNLRLNKYFSKWKDIQKLFTKNMGFSRPLSLDTAVRGVDYKFSGNMHTRIDDAINEAYLYQMLFNETLFEERTKPLRELFEPSPDVTTSLGDIFTEDIKKQLGF